jgi:CRP-like cAMP-binding protein
VPSLLDFGPFLALPEEARDVLSARSRVARFARGDRLLRAGEEPDAALAVLAGRVRVTGADGTVLSTMSAPALVGEMAVLEGRKRAADVVALEPGRALRIDAGDLRGIAAQHDEFARALEAFADARRINAFLRREGPFADLPSDEIEELAAKLRPAHYDAGDTVFRQGETGDDVLLVREGEIDVVRDDPAGERRLARLGPGSLVGEIAVLTGSPRTATAQAATTSSQGPTCARW